MSMVVFIVERVTPSVRGELSKWLLEPQAGVFVGTVSAAVRDRLWQRIAQRRRMGSMLLVTASDTEQGFEFRVAGDPKRSVMDLEGLQMIALAP